MRLKLFIAGLVMFCGMFSYSQTTRIIDFGHLLNDLNNGEKIRIAIDYGKCNWHDTTIQKRTPEAVTGMAIDTYEYFAPGAIHNPKAFVVFSTTKLIQNPRGKGYVYNYGKVRIFSDNTVQITATYIHPRTYKERMNQVFTGIINNGTNGEGIHLYK